MLVLAYRAHVGQEICFIGFSLISNTILCAFSFLIALLESFLPFVLFDWVNKAGLVGSPQVGPRDVALTGPYCRSNANLIQCMAQRTWEYYMIKWVLVTLL